MRTSTLRRYTCSNSSSGELAGRPRVRAFTATGRSSIVLTGALASVLMSLVALFASGCDIARPSRGPSLPAWRLIPPRSPQLPTSRTWEAGHLGRADAPPLVLARLQPGWHTYIMLHTTYMSLVGAPDETETTGRHGWRPAVLLQRDRVATNRPGSSAGIPRRGAGRGVAVGSPPPAA